MKTQIKRHRTRHLIRIYTIVTHPSILDTFKSYIWFIFPDKFDLSHGICSNATLSTDQTIHLLYHDPSSSYSECQCSVTSSSQFSVSLNDVRLRSETVTRKQCSPSTLQVHTKQYVCDDEKADYGSVFNKKWPDLMSMVSVVLDTNSSEFLPEMVWLIIEPKGMFQIL